MKINRIIPSIMIMASGLAGCGEHAPRKVQTSLNSLMANKPVKEFIAIKAGWREGFAKDADAQHSLDSVAFRRILPTTFNNDSAVIAEFNKVAAQTRLKNVSSYDKAYEELDKKIIEQGITTAKHESNLAEYRGLKITHYSWPGSTTSPNNREILKLRQFNLDSLAFKNFFDKNFKITHTDFEKTASDIKPREIW